MDFKSFMREKEKLNELVFNYNWLNIRKFFNLDSKLYEENILLKKIKELIESIAFIILRCITHINYHPIKCYEKQIIERELREYISIALIVSGSNQYQYIIKAFRF